MKNSFFENNLNSKKWRRKFKIVFNVLKIAIKQFKMAEIGGERRFH
jgi:hypothetical protein